MKNRIKNLLLENGLDSGDVVIGQGELRGHLNFDFDARNSKEVIAGTAKLAVKYFSDKHIIIIWQVKGTEQDREFNRKKFTVKYADVYRDFDMRFTIKNVEFKNRGTEKVWFFREGELEEMVIKIKELLE